MAFLQFNTSTVKKVTAPSTSADDLSITIGSKTYSESFDTDAATTIDNFLISHGGALNQVGVLAVDSATTLDLYGVNKRSFTSDNSFTDADESIVKPADILDLDVDSADNLVFTLGAGGTNTSTVSVSYYDDESRNSDRTRVLQEVAIGRPIVKVSSASKAVES